MSSYSCPIVKIDQIVEHPNADRLDIALIGGYRCVVAKDAGHKAGDLIVYIPTGSLLPEEVITKLNLTGKLTGRGKNRVKAVRLRQEYSEGVVMPLSVFRELAPILPSEPIEEGFDEAHLILGIEKYVEEIPAQLQGIARPRPEWFPRYTDIENWKKHSRVLAQDEYVVATEKIHGTNAGYGLHVDNLEQLYVSSRNLVLEYDENNTYWKAGIDYDIHTVLKTIQERTTAQSVVLWGEIFGGNIQDLNYSSSVPRFRWFDLMIDGQYCDYRVAKNLIPTSLMSVPVLYQGPMESLELEAITSGSETVSGHYEHMIEGIVIRPISERFERGLGRVILKYIGREYELRKNGTERQ